MVHSLELLKRVSNLPCVSILKGFLAFEVAPACSFEIPVRVRFAGATATFELSARIRFGAEAQ